ncbi:ABC transporter ATP-binding protein [Stutzerimonas kirkiae]|uniref:ABC transporter ATP-binding protein n=1 Tax=Stutzerimonas kirkiae TaxID=2211392 RepID=A0A4Q9RAH6_9GAMM|nr:ABC transporter ATP-binding protein [Stutzerimonas kirkiae]TBU97192.1 ABC transporter ATP-binding protein [Stutzerimonas kirkiae]TBV03614.1 ABC transporter ATP-binding protein [Stutzerimonas kirkiae]TBV11402.1 ABC transporter ATP-binding protein [Stutzerimonas kirkiae]TBV12508.1 ABC transporter ATP-binding protein [Stutzerimonas kirkiae]
MSWLALEAVGLAIDGKRLLDSISLEVEQGCLLGLIGPNGAGKSSLLKALAHLLPYSGAIRLDGQDLKTLDPRQRALRLAYLGQGDESGWPLRLGDYVALGRLPHRTFWGLPSQADRQAVAQAMADMALTGLASRRVDSLSGGERARARLARALAVGSPLLLADEPVAALDPFHQLNVMQMLGAQCRQGRSVLVVLHDLTLASRFCDRVLLLDQGRVVEYGSPRQVLTPKNLQQVYKVQAMLGEHQQQPFVLPWACRPEGDGA